LGFLSCLSKNYLKDFLENQFDFGHLVAILKFFVTCSRNRVASHRVVKPNH